MPINIKMQLELIGSLANRIKEWIPIKHNESNTKFWLDLKPQLTSPAKCGVFDVKQVTTVHQVTVV